MLKIKNFRQGLEEFKGVIVFAIHHFSQVGRPVIHHLAAYQNHLRSIFKLESQGPIAEVLN